MSRIGIAISGGPNPADIIDLVVLAESLGYESAWVAEGHGGDQFAILAACAIRTSRIRLGTSISSVFVRTAPTIAMAASTIADLSGGRFILGLGSSHKAQVEPEHGIVYSKPLTRTRETVAIVRELIREGRVHFEGETIRIGNFDLWYTPRHRNVPVYLSTVFQKGIALCGEVADGIILTSSTLATAAQVRNAFGRRCRQGRTRSEPDRGHLFIAGLGRRNPRGGARGVAARDRVLLRVFPALQPDDGGARLRDRSRGDRRGLGARRPRNGRARGERRDDRRDQRVGHAGSMPRPDRGVPAIGH
jgi:alkanesulfonate monooxygenase SsuD/methylene tetrahydromethanopterin reductase-like flavin-dependent oxidoreductase (luciferase family)